MHMRWRGAISLQGHRCPHLTQHGCSARGMADGVISRPQNDLRAIHRSFTRPHEHSRVETCLCDAMGQNAHATFPNPALSPSLSRALQRLSIFASLEIFKIRPYARQPAPLLLIDCFVCFPGYSINFNQKQFFTNFNKHPLARRGHQSGAPSPLRHSHHLLATGVLNPSRLAPLF